MFYNFATSLTILSAVSSYPYRFGILPNFLGFVALVLYILSLVPGITRSVFSQYRTNKINIYLTKQRRHIGVWAFVFALAHGILIGIDRELNFLDPAVILKYIQGVSGIVILTALAVTSNDYSLHVLKKKWRTLHKLTYLLIFILPWHILDKMYGHWSAFTFTSLLLLFFVLVLSAKRIYNYYLKSASIKKQPNPSDKLDKV